MEAMRLPTQIWLLFAGVIHRHEESSSRPRWIPQKTPDFESVDESHAHRWESRSFSLARTRLHPVHTPRSPQRMAKVISGACVVYPIVGLNRAALVLDREGESQNGCHRSGSGEA